MEFVGFAELWPQLKSRGIVERHPGEFDRGPRAEARTEDGFEVGIEAARQPVTLLIGPAPTSTAAPSPAKTKPRAHIACESERIAATLETVLHKLHLAPLYVIPVGRWREIFDVVSFGLAAHDAWQEIDSQASLQQKTRDPLVCGPGDLHMLREVVRVLLSDGEPDAGQAITIVATGQVLVARVEPKRPVQLLVGGSTVADQLRDAAQHFLHGSPPHA